ncbi:ATP-binding protein [Hoeflea alexandrii]|uniref:ATP-binding protein n=1 Tax=Hoeflea alexandrii TaxID=288436 RepID=UPI0035CFAD21
MSLVDKVYIAPRFQRAIRIDVDLGQAESLDGFLCPQSSVDVLSAMARHIADTKQGAFTWTGPYGSGKSSLVVALSALLSANKTLRNLAVSSIGEATANEIRSGFGATRKGWQTVAAVGRRDDASRVIGEALIAAGLASSRRSKPWDGVSIIEALSEATADKTHGGVIMFIDEMGKLLEGAAKGESDVYLFQQLAEAASRSEGRLIVVGVLHQAFEEYANRLSRDFRDEWSKVQGRFIDLVVNAAGEEQIDLISRAITTEAAPKSYVGLAGKVAKEIQARKPGTSDFLDSALTDCWPLHPIVAALLGPISRRRFGQNQRSIFGFLNSAEPNGLQDFLRRAKDRDLYSPDRLWDYLQLNLEPSILASPDGHRWSIAVEAIERLGAIGGDEAHIKLLKVVSLVDLFKERSGLVASEKLLSAAFPRLSDAELRSMLQRLSEWSLIAYRKFLGGYAVYAGSDFDIEAATERALGDIEGVDFEQLRTLASLQPIMAKRHYHETGSLRWFDVEIAPLSVALQEAAEFEPGPSTIGLFLLAIPTFGESEDAAMEICKRAARLSGKHDIVVGLSSRSWSINNLSRELLALEKVRNGHAELQGDPVARREINARIVSLQAKLEQELQRAFDGAQWFQKQHSPKQLMQDELNGLASDLADKRFPLSPVLNNELLNRIKPSTNAVAGQNALLRRMVDYEGQERLGITGYPTEGGMFESVLSDSGLYSKTKDGWHFVQPDEEADKARLRPLWEATSEFLLERKSRPVSLSEVYELWRSAPFGVKDGMMPVLAVSYILSRRNNVALYRHGVFQARFTDLDVDYLAKDPRDIQLRWMNLSDVARRLLSGLASIVRDLDQSNSLENLEPIDVGRGLISIYTGLPHWAQRTMRLSANAIKIRDLFKRARDPNQFIFNDLPQLAGSGNDLETEDGFQRIIGRVRDALEEMVKAYPQMLERLANTTLAELQVPNNSSQALADLRARAENIRELSGDFNLNAFVNRLCEYQGSLTDIEGLAGFAVSKPSKNWIDSDLDNASIKLAEYAQNFNKSEAFARVKGRPDKRHAMAIVVGVGGRPVSLLDEFDVTDAELENVQQLLDELREVLNKQQTARRSVILAALAELSAEIIRSGDTDSIAPEQVTVQ